MTVGPVISYHDRLRHARLNADLTRQELADFIGCPVSTVKQAELGARELGATRLFAWARITRINLEWIATGQGDPRTTPLRRRP